MHATVGTGYGVKKRGNRDEVGRRTALVEAGLAIQHGSDPSWVTYITDFLSIRTRFFSNLLAIAC